MIIDLETQVWTNPAQLGAESTDWRLREDVETWASIDASPAVHEAAMSCVDVAVVLGFRSVHLDAHITSESVAAFVGRQPNRRIGFAGIDPMCDGALDEVDKGLALGLCGVVIAPAAQNFHPTHSRAMRVYERCQSLGIPVLVRTQRRPTASTNMAYGRPLLFDEVARAFPNLKLVIGGLGYPWTDELFILVGKHRNVFTDLAGQVSRPWQLYHSLVGAFEHRVMEKILFASGFPFDTPERAISRIYSLNSYSHGTDLPSIPRQHLRGIVERDVFHCLGIERPGGASLTGGMSLATEAVEVMEEDDDLDAQITTLTGMLRESVEPNPRWNS